VGACSIDVIVVYKVDRLTRSLADFAKLVELFDDHGVSFVSVTQQFNTTTSMGRLALNVLLSFAQFEREVTSERIRAARHRQARNVPRSGCLFLPCHRPITKTLPPDAVGIDRFTYTVQDGQGGSVSTSLTFVVTDPAKTCLGGTSGVTLNGPDGINLF
jgi:DNA invertase Pin-like site-specific DNA recombinase